MHYEIQVLVKIDATGKKDWRALRPSNGQPYSFATFSEAVRMASICYPDNPEDVRIKRTENR